MTCDSAYYYSNENKIEAFSKIKIWQGDTLSLEGDYLIYYGNIQLAVVKKNIKLKHNNLIITSEKIRYNFNKKGFFDQKVVINEKNKLLKSNQGIYDASIEKFDFYNNVYIETKEDTLFSDTLYYWLDDEYLIFQSNGSILNNKLYIKAQHGWVNQKIGEAFLTKNVEITNLENNSIVKSDTSYFFNEMNHSISYGNTLLSIPLDKDTLHLTADTLFQKKKHEDNLLLAYPNVNFKSIDMTGYCDSLSYSINEDNIFLNKEPVIWLDEFQLTSDSIQIILKKNEIYMAFLYKGAFIASKIDSLSYN